MQHIGMGDLMSEDFRVLYVWYYADADWMGGPMCADCEWFVPGTLIED